MSVFKEYACDPTEEHWQACVEESAGDFEPPAPPPCSMCPHFVSAEFPEWGTLARVGICEEFALELHKAGESMGLAVTTEDSRVCEYHKWQEV